MTAAKELGIAADAATLVFWLESIKMGPRFQTIIALGRSYVGFKKLARRTAPQIRRRPLAPDAFGLKTIATRP